MSVIYILHGIYFNQYNDYYSHNRSLHGDHNLNKICTLAAGTIAAAVSLFLLLFQLLWNYELVSRRGRLNQLLSKVRRFHPNQNFLQEGRDLAGKKGPGDTGGGVEMIHAHHTDAKVGPY
jgi:hypothetical protein